MKGRGINNLAKFLDSSPSPQPSPLKGEGVFLTFYDSIKKGEPMRKKAVLVLAAVGIPIFLVLAMGSAWAQLKVGGEAPSFQLPSSQDQLVDYYKDYYGKYHLVMTFFPAAFTPV
jgi:hypothetical protein